MMILKYQNSTTFSDEAKLNTNITILIYYPYSELLVIFKLWKWIKLNIALTWSIMVECLLYIEIQTQDWTSMFLGVYGT